MVDEQSTVGCYRKPPNIQAKMEQYTVDMKWQAARCILQCEHVGLVLAIPMQYNICYCGLTWSRYDFTRVFVVKILAYENAMDGWYSALTSHTINVRLIAM